MKHVTLTRDLRPWRAGDKALVPDDIAEGMMARGEASEAEPWPPSAAPPAPKQRFRTKERA